MASSSAAAAQLRRRAAAAARRHHPTAAVAPSRRATAFQIPAASPASSALLRPRAAGTRNTSRALCGQASDPVLDPLLLRIPPKIWGELSRIELAGISCDRQIDQELTKLTATVAEHHSNDMIDDVEAAMRIGRISWRVSTTILTVTVAAGLGLVQVAKPGWEAGYDMAACDVITKKMDAQGAELEISLSNAVKKKMELKAVP